jgi:leucyl aminopeptidase
MKTALDCAATGIFSTSDIVWRELKKAGAETGDRLWRFPFWDHYTKMVTGTGRQDATGRYIIYRVVTANYSC